MSTYPHAPGFIAGDRPQIVTSRFQYEDSYTLDRYLATEGYEGLRAAVRRTPQAVHEEVRSATLLGRGGAGFPAGVKWGLTPQGVWPRYLVVNGDESEPGTYKDRLLMELDPHQLIEGCLIACYAAGLSQCFLYIRGEMALAQERVATALNEAYAAGYIGKHILGTDFSVDIVMQWGAGAYVVGEETALIESLEGNRGMPRLKPPFFPAAIGLYGQPTIVNNVETLANLPWLLRNGAAAYTAIGTETSPGTRMVAVSGHVHRPAVFEIVNGTTTFRDLIDGEEFCQGIRDGRRLKAFVPGGGSAPWFVEDQLDLPVRGQARRCRRFDARVGGDHGDGRDHRHPLRRLDAGPLLRPRIVWQVRAVPRGRHVARAHPATRRRGARGAGGPRADARGGRVDLPRGVSPCRQHSPGHRGRAVPLQDDDDLLRRTLGVRPDPLGGDAVPRRVRGPHQAPHAHSRDGCRRSGRGRRRRRSPMTDRPKPGESAAPAEAAEAAVTEPADATVAEAGVVDEPEPDPNAVSITLNGRQVTARKGELIIAAAERHGEYIPRFCWHNRMSSVGMCRMCLVEVDSGRGPQITPSCMVTVAPDMKVDTESATTKRVQEGMLELLLANHPLDCPVCDKGGECPLQDQAFSHGPGREPVRRGEAPLREADPDQRPRPARPRALHPVRPLHALRRRGGRRSADQLHPPRQPRPRC